MVLFVLSTSQVPALEACTTMPALGNILLEHNHGCVLTRCLGLLVGYKDGASSCRGWGRLSVYSLASSKTNAPMILSVHRPLCCAWEKSHFWCGHEGLSVPLVALHLSFETGSPMSQTGLKLTM